MAKNTPPGPGVDASGQSVQDPSLNVKELAAADARRQDDLREAAQRMQELQAQHLKELVDRETQHLQEMAAKDEYCNRELRHADQELRLAESARLDAIRAVDINAVSTAAQAVALQAETLRKEVSNSADTLRTTVAATALQNTETLNTALTPIKTDVADLRRVQYEQAGQQAQVVEARDVKGETRTSTGLIVTIISVAFGLLFGLLGLIATGVGLYLSSRP